MPYIQGDIPTTISVTNLIVEYLENSDDVVLPQRVESIILQNVLQWLQSEHIDIRWNATRILLTMSRNPENDGVVNHQLVNLIDSNSAYIKNLIMRHLHKMRGITDKTREHIINSSMSLYTSFSIMVNKNCNPIFREMLSIFEEIIE